MTLGTSVVSIAYFEIRVFFAPYFMPPAVDVMTERAGTHLPEAVLLGDVFGFENNVFQGYVL
jgi:hypothetical protein